MNLVFISRRSLPLTVMALAMVFIFSGCVPKSELEDAVSRAERAEAKLKLVEAQLREKLAEKPNMPIRIMTREETGLLGRHKGYVAIFDTTIKKDLRVLVTISSRALGTRQQYTLDVPWFPKPLSETSLPIHDGDSISVHNADYKDLNVTANLKK